MIDFFKSLFEPDNFMPHGHCYLWNPGLLWLHITSDAFITVAYYSIPFTLIHFIRKRRDIPFNWMFLCFAIFIVACGTTHLLEIWVIWHPAYWLSGVIKAITAIVSVPTAFLLVKLLPQALALPSPSALKAANAELQREIGERERAQTSLRALNDELERRVAQRTQQLEAANENLLKDAEERTVAEEEIRKLNANLELRVAQRTAELEAANKELEAFSYSVSHDLRAPLRSVNGFAGIMLEDYGSLLPEEGRRHLERIRNGGRQMGQLIDDLLAFARLNRQPVNRRQVDMTGLVQEVLTESDPVEKGRLIEFRTGGLPPCEGDTALLKQVWINLLSNAVKYTRGRTPAIIETGSELRENEPVYFMRDNGVGFDMKYANKLFGVFQRLHRADEFEGTGVGLAIVQRIIHRHGGRVWAEAEPDRGATFYFTIGPREKT